MKQALAAASASAPVSSVDRSPKIDAARSAYMIRVDGEIPQSFDAYRMKRAKKKPLRIRSGNPTDLWSQVAAKEADERRQFDPLLKSFAILADEHLEQSLSIVERRDSEDQRRNVLVQDMLFELAWRTDFRRTEEPIEESHFWDDLRAFILRRGDSEGTTFQFPVWTIHLGRRIADAWMCRDDEFFARHADLWRVLCQTDGKAEGQAPTHVARICGVALALRERLKCDPTKKQLRDEIAKLGLRISEKDWPKYLRKCDLTFLPQARGGRPKVIKSPDSRKRQSDG